MLNIHSITESFLFSKVLSWITLTNTKIYISIEEHILQDLGSCIHTSTFWKTARASDKTLDLRSFGFLFIFESLFRDSIIRVTLEEFEICSTFYLQGLFLKFLRTRLPGNFHPSSMVHYLNNFPAYTAYKAGLPDFSRFNIPKIWKNMPSDHKIYQMAIKYPKWP
jgi:hypothetical protein